MWSKSYSQKVTGISIDKLWKVWTDVNQWHHWQEDIDFAHLQGPFEAGNSFLFKPKGGPKFNIELLEVEPGKIFVDLTRFPLTRMIDIHEIIDHGKELEVKTTISVEGILSFFWRKLVIENIVKGLDVQTAKLIQRAKDV